MARGFDSKSVADQQEEKERADDRDDVRGGAAKPAVSARRKTLELARIDLLRRLDAAPEIHREALKAALDDLDDLIRRA
jgi:hypothetical protein